MDCSKKLKCVEREREYLCKTIEYSLNKIGAFCEEKDSRNCEYSLGWGGNPSNPHFYICECPIRKALIEKIFSKKLFSSNEIDSS